MPRLPEASAIPSPDSRLRGNDARYDDRMKRRLLRTCLFLLLGAIVNVAVAWSCAALCGSEQPIDVAVKIPQTGDGWSLVTQRASFGKVQNWDHGLRPASEVRVDGVNLIQTCYPTCGNDDTGPWQVTYPIRQASWSRSGWSEGDWIVTDLAAGWPALALWGCAGGFDRESGEPMHSYTIAFGDIETVAYLESHKTCLPCRPLCPGFAINTAFYAAIVWLLLAAPFALRRQRRIRRGQCPNCAYPVGVNDRCTECGAAVRPNAS